MPFLTEVHFQNYRSFLDAKCRLSPVTVVIGANNAGKSNFLRGIGDLLSSLQHGPSIIEGQFTPGRTHRDEPTVVRAVEDTGRVFSVTRGEQGFLREPFGGQPLTYGRYLLDAEASRDLHSDEGYLAMTTSPVAVVCHQGAGVTKVLETLSQTKPEVFQRIESEWRKFVPEIEKLSIAPGEHIGVSIHAMEKGNPESVPLHELSEGSRLALFLITLLHQPVRPGIILLEDVEHAIHPRGLKPMVEMIRQISKEHGVQVIMTTQAPYVLDSFQPREFWGDVVIVEKTNGVSRLTNADERLIALGYEREMRNVPLGDMWFSGILGGMAGPNKLWDEPTPDPEKP